MNQNKFADLYQKLRTSFSNASNRIKAACTIIDLSDEAFQEIFSETIEEEMKVQDSHTIANPFGAPRTTFMDRGLN